jgi:putative membrane protein
MDDHKFVKEAALGGMANVAIGKLAAEKASSDAVKQFGQKVADEHAKSNDELRKVAAKKSVGLPDSLDSKHQARVDKLAKLSGPEFDRAFLKDQTKNHQQSIKDFEAESENGTDPDVKAFASKTLPTLQQHLSLAKNLSKNKAAPVAEVR